MKRIIIIISSVVVCVCLVFCVAVLIDNIAYKNEEIPIFSDGTSFKMTESKIISIKGVPVSTGEYKSNNGAWCEYNEKIYGYNCKATYIFADTLLLKKLSEVYLEIVVESEKDFNILMEKIKKSMDNYYHNNDDYLIEEKEDAVEISIDNGATGTFYTVEYKGDKCLISCKCLF